MKLTVGMLKAVLPLLAPSNPLLPSALYVDFDRRLAIACDMRMIVRFNDLDYPGNGRVFIPPEFVKQAVRGAKSSYVIEVLNGTIGGIVYTPLDAASWSHIPKLYDRAAEDIGKVSSDPWTYPWYEAKYVKVIEDLCKAFDLNFHRRDDRISLYPGACNSVSCVINARRGGCDIRLVSDVDHFVKPEKKTP